MQHQSYLYIENWRFEPDCQQLTRGSEVISLKPLLSKLLWHFISHPYQTFSYDSLKQQVWQQQYLTDSAVKKAISELRSALAKVSDSDTTFIKNEPNKGYSFVYDVRSKGERQTAVSLQQIIQPFALFTLLAIASIVWYVSEQNPINAESNHHTQSLFASTSIFDDSTEHYQGGFVNEEAYENFIKGKIAYYRSQNPKLASSLFAKSLEMQPEKNPSAGALLDIYGLKERSQPLPYRKPELKSQISEHIGKLKSQQMVTDNVVALVKYHIVNQGDAKEALKVIKKANVDIKQSYDLHVAAFAYALNGDKENSSNLIEIAEKRFPERNAVIWYKAYIALINGDIEGALEQSEWAQQVSPDWYPMVYVAPRLLLGKEQEAFEHLQRFSAPLLDNQIAQFESFTTYMNHLAPQLENLHLQPFEALLVYLMAKHLGNAEQAYTAQTFIEQNYPEKQLIVEQIDLWLEDSTIVAQQRH